MGLLRFVRHGQASLHAADYDQLSDLGHRQSLALGRYLATQPLPSRVYVGPLRRHQQTWAAICSGIGAKAEALDIHELAEFDEHQALEMMAREHPQGPQGQDTKAWFAQFDQTMRDWIQGTVVHQDLESWQQARMRVDRGVERLKQEANGGLTLVVSSGGAISMTVGQILGLDDLGCYALALELRNTGLVDVRRRQGQLFLRSFNELPHIDDPAEETMV